MIWDTFRPTRFGRFFRRSTKEEEREGIENIGYIYMRLDRLKINKRNNVSVDIRNILQQVDMADLNVTVCYNASNVHANFSVEILGNKSSQYLKDSFDLCEVLTYPVKSVSMDGKRMINGHQVKWLNRFIFLLNVSSMLLTV